MLNSLPMPKTLYVTCPAYALHGPLDRQKVADSAAWLGKELGLEPVLSPLLDRHAGHGAWLPRPERERDLLAALGHDLVWACRGGFGSIELVAPLLKARPRKRPGLIGYSDITVLHACWRVRGWGPGFYGTVSPRSAAGRAGQSLAALLRGEGLARDQRVDAGARVLRPGRARGRLFPACLGVLAGLCGTPAMPDLRGCLLAIEDINIHPFLMSFNLGQLHLAGALRGVTGIVGGSFTCEEPLDYVGPSQDEVLAEWAGRLGVPAVSRLPFGHLDDALVLPVGRPAELSATRGGRWSLAIAAERGAMPWA
jgi:muramoyltetrapeptide carboxypeptidase